MTRPPRPAEEVLREWRADPGRSFYVPLTLTGATDELIALIAAARGLNCEWGDVGPYVSVPLEDLKALQAALAAVDEKVNS